MKKVIILGAGGGLAKFVISELQKFGDVEQTLFLRNRNNLTITVLDNCKVVEGDVMDYSALKNAIAGKDIVYVNLAGNLGAMAENIVMAMNETGIKRVIAISSIGIYDTPLKPVLKPYKALADVFENSGLDYTILRPTWFSGDSEVNYEITHKGEPEKGSEVSKRSIASFICKLVEQPELYVGESLGINKPN